MLFADQDRRLWDRDLIAEGQDMVRQCLRRNQPGPYRLQAAINAVHSDAPAAAATDWRQILWLYDRLLAVAPGPGVALNRAVALAELSGPKPALDLVDALELENCSLFNAVRADFLFRLGRNAEAVAAYNSGLSLAGNAADRRFLEARRRESGLRSARPDPAGPHQDSNDQTPGGCRRTWGNASAAARRCHHSRLR